MILDSHTHLFSPRVIENVSNKRELVEELHLEVENAQKSCSLTKLEEESSTAGVSACLLLPTAQAEDVSLVNARFQELVQDMPQFLTAGTLHPDCPEIEQLLSQLKSKGIRALKFCSFSQGFGLDDPESVRMFELIQEHNRQQGSSFFVVLDSFFKADVYFGAPSRHLTTPERLARLASRFPGLSFVGAHMGSLAAPFEEARKHLQPRKNLFLETSNAAHTLEEDEFVYLLKVHGPERILFGTDWPWFSHKKEIPLIGHLLERAGFGKEERSRVFFENGAALLGLKAC